MPLRAALTLFVLALPQAALACECFAPKAANALAAAVVVVEGVVARAEPLPDPKHRFDGRAFAVDVAVERLWKGRDLVRWVDGAAQVTFYAVGDEDACGYRAQAGQRHLLFLSRSPYGHLTTGLCSGNARSERQRAKRRGELPRSVVPRGGAWGQPGCAGCNAHPKAPSPGLVWLGILLALMPRRRQAGVA